ncbi:uncharacterized protein LOC127860161 [Dreissena polymorpha]|nr:uncharacterized protein LOC127860161 [Dreissena polymorpha]
MAEAVIHFQQQQRDINERARMPRNMGIKKHETIASLVERFNRLKLTQHTEPVYHKLRKDDVIKQRSPVLQSDVAKKRSPVNEMHMRNKEERSDSHCNADDVKLPSPIQGRRSKVHSNRKTIKKTSTLQNSPSSGRKTVSFKSPLYDEYEIPRLTREFTFLIQSHTVEEHNYSSYGHSGGEIMIDASSDHNDLNCKEEKTKFVVEAEATLHSLIRTEHSRDTVSMYATISSHDHSAVKQSSPHGKTSKIDKIDATQNKFIVPNKNPNIHF